MQNLSFPDYYEKYFPLLLQDSLILDFNKFMDIKTLAQHGDLFVNTFIKVPRRTIVITFGNEGDIISIKNSQEPRFKSHHNATVIFIKYVMQMMNKLNNQNRSVDKIDTLYTSIKNNIEEFKKKFDDAEYLHRIKYNLNIYFEDDLIPDALFRGDNEMKLNNIHDWKDIPQQYKKSASIFKSISSSLQKFTQYGFELTLGKILDNFASRGANDIKIRVCIAFSCRFIEFNWPIMKHPDQEFFFKDVFHRLLQSRNTIENNKNNDHKLSVVNKLFLMLDYINFFKTNTPKRNALKIKQIRDEILRLLSHFRKISYNNELYKLQDFSEIFFKKISLGWTSMKFSSTENYYFYKNKNVRVHPHGVYDVYYYYIEYKDCQDISDLFTGLDIYRVHIPIRNSNKEILDFFYGNPYTNEINLGKYFYINNNIQSKFIIFYKKLIKSNAYLTTSQNIFHDWKIHFIEKINFEEMNQQDQQYFKEYIKYMYDIYFKKKKFELKADNFFSNLVEYPFPFGRKINHYNPDEIFSRTIIEATHIERFKEDSSWIIFESNRSFCITPFEYQLLFYVVDDDDQKIRPTIELLLQGMQNNYETSNSNILQRKRKRNQSMQHNYEASNISILQKKRKRNLQIESIINYLYHIDYSYNNLELRNKIIDFQKLLPTYYHSFNADLRRKINEIYKLFLYIKDDQQILQFKNNYCICNINLLFETNILSRFWQRIQHSLRKKNNIITNSTTYSLKQLFVWCFQDFYKFTQSLPIFKYKNLDTFSFEYLLLLEKMLLE